jgi:anti-sigma B factor antagonist
MEIQHTEYENCDVIKLTGRIDSETVPEIKSKFDKLFSDRKFRLVLDMTDVNFVSSSGWWMLINTQKICKRNEEGEIVLSGLAKRIKHSLELVGMDDYFKTTDSVPEAMELFSS